MPNQGYQPKGTLDTRNPPQGGSALTERKRTSNIVSFSGGKDSTAMLLMMIEKKIPIDFIVFFETGWDFPGMIEHINTVEKQIGREIIRLKPNKSFKELFDKYGFPSLKGRWCLAYKRDTLRKFTNAHKPNIQWLGFAKEEAKRIKKTIGYCYPLVDWKITEEQALTYCQKKGYTWGGLYENRKRVSCWNCPLQSLKDLKILWKDHPGYWQELINMQKYSDWKFRNDYTLKELEEKFKKE